MNMGLWTRRLLVGMIVGLLAGASLVPMAYAQQEQSKDGVENTDEAWFFRHRQPLAGAPIPDDPNDGPVGDAGAIGKATLRDQTNVYAQGDPEAVHVGVNAGQPEARTFVHFDMFSLADSPLPPRITGGTLTLTNAPGPERGNRNVDGAEMIACVATDLVVGAMGGDWDDMYEYDCGFSAPLEREEGSDPAVWTVDLQPLAGFWAENEYQGIAIVEAGEGEEAETGPQDTWHVAFWGMFNEDPEAQPITADLTFVAEELDLPDITGGGFDDAGGFDDGGGSFDSGDAGSFDGGGFDEGGFDDSGADFGDAGAPEVADGEFGEESEEADAPEVAMGEDSPQAAGPMEEQSAGGMPAVFLLPFLAVGLAGLLGYSLTQEPDLPEAREGAVSRLMRNRRAGGAGPADAA
jgi:hypothetical protein